MSDFSLRKAAMINAVSKYVTVVFSLLFMMVLARILTPKDYGIVAVVMVFSTFFQMLSDMGISTGIIQYKNLTQKDVNSIFAITIIFGLLLSLLFGLFSFAVADFYDDDVYVSLGWILAVSLFFCTSNIVPNALMLKDKQFLALAKRNIVISFITGVLTIIFALLEWKYYALAMQSVLSALFMLLINYMFARKNYGLMLSPKLDMVGLKKIFSYSAYQFLFNFINYFTRNLDNLLIGRVWGAESLGFYDKAYRLSCYPNQIISNIIASVLQPVLSDYQDDKYYIYKTYVKLLKFLSLVGGFIVVLCYFSSHGIILVMFGEQWGCSSSLFEMLSLSIWPQLILSTTGGIFQSIGDTKRLFVTGCINTSIMILAIILGIIENDLLDLSRNVMIAFYAQFFISMYILIKLSLKYKYCNFMSIFCPDLLIGILLACVGYLMEGYLPEAECSSLVCRLIVLLIVYAFLCKAFKQEKYILILYKRKG